MTLRPLAFVLMLLASTAFLAGAASAATASTVLATAAPGPAAADGTTTIAFVPHVGTVRLRDMQVGTSVDADVRDACTTPPTRVSGVGGGQVLLLCGVRPGQLSPEPRLLDVRTQRLHEVVGARAVLDAAARDSLGDVGIAFDGVGAAGVQYFHYAYHGDYVGVLDWRTGAQLGEGDAEEAVDLDRAGLFMPLCNPLRRVATRYETDGPAFYPYAYEAPYGIAARSQFDVRSGSPTLTLQRCGGRRQLVLSRDDPQDVQLRAGIATWTSGFRPHAFLTACGVNLDWQGARFVSAAHTREAVVVSRADRDDGPWRIEVLGVAGVCRRTHAAWTLTVSNGHRSARLQAQAATLSLPRLGAAGATLRSLVTSTTGRLALGRGTTVRLRPDGAARALYWRLGKGFWHPLRAHGGVSRIRLGRLSGARTLTIHVRYRQGGVARFAVRLRPR